MPHAAMTARWSQYRPLPVRKGLKPSATALTKCFSGNTQPTRSSQSGSWTMKMSEMKASRISPPLVSACVAPGVGTIETAAMPSAAKQKTPTTTVSRTAGTVRQTMSTS